MIFLNDVHVSKISLIICFLMIFEICSTNSSNHLIKRELNWGDAPEYEKNINLLMSYSQYETKEYIMSIWKLPEVVAYHYHRISY